MPKDKQGNKLTWSEFFSKWKSGILNLTPAQKVSNEFNATIVMLVGFIVALVVLIIFRDKLLVSWFAYGLILIFAGNTWTTIIKLIGFYQQKQFFKNMERQLEENEDEEEVNIKTKKSKRRTK